MARNNFLLLCFLWLTFISPNSHGTVGVATPHPLATEVGMRTLSQGGNAVDAAVAAAFALGVVAPYHAGIGGGALILIRPAHGDEPIVIDALESAPRGATAPAAEGWPAVGVPGCVAGLTTARDQYGTWDLPSLIAPAIHLADHGFPMDAPLHQYLQIHAATGGGSLPWRWYTASIGERIERDDLAWSYRQIARYGSSAFYQGSIAAHLLRATEGDWLSHEDLQAYRVRLRRPIHTNYRAYEVLTAPPPCGAGLPLIQSLNILKPFSLPVLGHNSTGYTHLLAEVLRRTSADRSRFIGDGDSQIPLRQLVSDEYAAHQGMPITLSRLCQWPDLPLLDEEAPPAGRSAHVTAVDGEGNMVVIALSLHDPFGSGIFVPHTGIILNNAMADFSQFRTTETPDEEALQPNLALPGRRPSTLMLPVVVLNQGQPFVALGCSGGWEMAGIALQVILNLVEFDMSVPEACLSPRLYRDFSQEALLLDWGMDVSIPTLIDLGYPVRRVPGRGTAQAIAAPPDRAGRTLTMQRD